MLFLTSYISYKRWMLYLANYKSLRRWMLFLTSYTFYNRWTLLLITKDGSQCELVLVCQLYGGGGGKVSSVIPGGDNAGGGRGISPPPTSSSRGYMARTKAIDPWWSAQWCEDRCPSHLKLTPTD